MAHKYDSYVFDNGTGGFLISNIMSNKYESPAPAQNEHPDTDVKNNASNHTAKNSAMIDPYDLLFNIEYDRIRINSALIAREQELVSRSQELVKTSMMANNALFDKLLTEIEKKLGIR